MSDRHKFKAWVPSLKKWADRVVVSGDGTHKCYAKGQLKASYGLPASFIEIHEESVLIQCIGRRDINKKLMLEGHIVAVYSYNGPASDKSIHEVVFIDGAFKLRQPCKYTKGGFQYAFITDEYKWKYGNASGTGRFEYEVIGNIFENGDLLEQGDE